MSLPLQAKTGSGGTDIKFQTSLESFATSSHVITLVPSSPAVSRMTLRGELTYRDAMATNQRLFFNINISTADFIRYMYACASVHVHMYFYCLPSLVVLNAHTLKFLGGHGTLTLGTHVQAGYYSKEVCSSQEFQGLCSPRVQAWECLENEHLVAHVCVLSHISPLEHLFILKILSRMQWATEVKKFSLKPLRCRDSALPLLKAIHTVSGPFPAKSAHAHYSIYCRSTTWWRQGFCMHFSAPALGILCLYSS